MRINSSAVDSSSSEDLESSATSKGDSKQVNNMFID